MPVILPSKKPIVALAILEGLVLAGVAALVFTQDLDPVTYLMPVVLFLSLPYAILAIRLGSSRLTLGDHQISHQTGLLAKQERAFDLSKIQDVRSEQSPFQRLTGTGTVIVQTASHDGGIRMEGVDSPQAVVKQILDAQRRSMK